MRSNRELPPNIELALIQATEEHVRKAFYEKARVTNFDLGYISVPFVNQLIDLELQGFAGDIIAHHYRKAETEMDKVIQIPLSGNPLATTVAERLNTPLVPGRKGKAIPGSWGHSVVVEEKIPSFTTGEMSTFVFNGLKEGDKVILIDDVIANGYTSGLIAKSLKEKGIEVVGIAVYFAKLFQPGVNRVREETGIDPFFVVGIENITQEGEIVLSPPHF